MSRSLGSVNLVNQSKSGICKNNFINQSGASAIIFLAEVPSDKIWVIQQLTIFNTSSIAKTVGFVILDENYNLVAYLSNQSNPIFSVASQGFGVYCGSGLNYLPYGWHIGAFMGLEASGPTEATFYYHVTEIDLN